MHTFKIYGNFCFQEIKTGSLLKVRAKSRALWNASRISHLLKQVHIIMQEHALLPDDIQAQGKQFIMVKIPNNPIYLTRFSDRSHAHSGGSAFDPSSACC